MRMSSKRAVIYNEVRDDRIMCCNTSHIREEKLWLYCRSTYRGRNVVVEQIGSQEVVIGIQREHHYNDGGTSCEWQSEQWQ
jgi:hypothetical protein